MLRVLTGQSNPRILRSIIGGSSRLNAVAPFYEQDIKGSDRRGEDEASRTERNKERSDLVQSDSPHPRFVSQLGAVLEASLGALPGPQGLLAQAKTHGIIVL